MATEFTVVVADRPGALADLAEVLARHAVNIVAIHGTRYPKGAIIQFITNNPDATINALGGGDIDYTVQEVLLLSVPDKPGALARLARALGDNGVNIIALYITINGQVALDVTDVAAAQRIALGLGMQ
jgi:hypothetical protein